MMRFEEIALVGLDVVFGVVLVSCFVMRKEKEIQALPAGDELDSPPPPPPPATTPPPPPLTIPVSLAPS